MGLDVHKETIAVSGCEESGLERSLGTIPNTPEAVTPLVRKLSLRGPLQVAYEPGPCGYVLNHQLRHLRIPCLVAAPTPRIWRESRTEHGWRQALATSTWVFVWFGRSKNEPVPKTTGEVHEMSVTT